MCLLYAVNADHLAGPLVASQAAVERVDRICSWKV